MKKFKSSKLLLSIFLLLTLNSMGADQSTYNPNVIEGEDIQIKKTSSQIQSGEKEAIQNITATFVYNENDMYSIYARPYNVTCIMLDVGEKISYIGGGDTSRWSIDQADSGSEDGMRTSVYIKPSSPGLRTNLIIGTDKRIYNINLYAAKDWFNPLVKFRYPTQELIAKTKKEESEEKLNVSFLDELNYKYKISDNRKFRKVSFSPKQVFDDGTKTIIEFNDKLQEMPTFYVFDTTTTKEDSQLQLVNYRTKGKYIIIDRIFEVGKLVLGKDEVTIIKK